MDIRPVPREEQDAFNRAFFRTMGFELPGDAARRRSERDFRPERSLGAYAEGRLVGTTYSHAFEMTLPGGTQLAAAGVTSVCAITTHRRRGIVSALMQRQLADARERGEPLAVLIASEGSIYGRWGYGPSISLFDFEIDARAATLRDPDASGGTVRFADADEADKRFPEMHDRWRRDRSGALNRPPSWWETIRDDRRPTSSEVLYEDATGRPQGFARYDVKASWEASRPAHTLHVHDLIALTDEAYRALWRYLLSADLVRTVHAGPRPVDEPLRWLLTDPRVLHPTRYSDFYWTRILDVEQVLGSRRYSIDVDVVLDVQDGLFEDLSGRFALSGSFDGASCERTSADPDLAMTTTELAAVAFGGTTLAELAQAGRVSERTPGALRRTDAAFAWTPKPWSVTWF